MLEWKVVTGEEKLIRKIKDMKERFEGWFRDFWEHKCTKEQMLSPESPLPHIYALMCLPPEQVKEEYPSYFYEKCSDCGNDTAIWIETSFSFCDEYGCGMTLCPRCARKLKRAINNMFDEVQTPHGERKDHE